MHRNVTENPRVGCYYAAGAVVLAVASTAGWPWAAPLLWPAISFSIVAIGYAGAGAGIYGKTNGRLPLRTRVIMGPVLLGQVLSLRHYRRHCRPWDEAAPGLLMGRMLRKNEAEDLLACGVTAVLDLTAEFSQTDALRQTVYCNLPILDLTAPNLEQTQAGVAFIREQAAEGVVYVHCKVGYSRTAALVGAYLMAAGHAGGAEEAIGRMQAARPGMVIRPEAVEALRAFHDALRRTDGRSP